MWRISFFLVLAFALSTGCARLSPGPIHEINTQRQVCLIRGFQDWYSSGIDRLADELKTSGIAVHAYREEQWKDIADALIAHRSNPIMLIGFSYGADDVISIARRLNDHHLPVRLLITIDPVTPDAVPRNVFQCVNFYQSNGIWDQFPWLRGIPLHRDSENSNSLENINVRRRLDLVEPNTSHATIAANAKVHRAIVDLVLRTGRSNTTHPL